ncbi:hypothetical protein DXA36_06365 [Eisenbergiella sp. OF01-20]|nr:hypothetical protein DXA36_06365 [Eisenbergiella sp. OF01-20]
MRLRQYLNKYGEGGTAGTLSSCCFFHSVVVICRRIYIMKSTGFLMVFIHNADRAGAEWPSVRRQSGGPGTEGHSAPARFAFVTGKACPNCCIFQK